MDIVGIFLVYLALCRSLIFRTAGGVGPGRMLHDVLRDGRAGNGYVCTKIAVVVPLAWPSCPPAWKEPPLICFQPVVDVFDGFEPGHARI